jgi:adenosylcobyric acid synthase
MDAKGPNHAADVDAALEEIAFAIEAHLDVDAMLTIGQLPAGPPGGADAQQQE